MNILIFDQQYENNHQDYMQPLVDNIENLEAILYKDFTQATQKVSNTIYDFIIIDFTTQDGKDLLAFIIKQNPQQKIITLSYELTSSENNCVECEQNYQKKRLIKPVSAIDIYNTVKNFETSKCKYFNHFENPKSLIGDIINRYQYFEYEQSKNIIQSRNKSYSDHTLKEYIDIIDVLHDYKIEYEIIDEYKIRVI